MFLWQSIFTVSFFLFLMNYPFNSCLFWFRCINLFNHVNSYFTNLLFFQCFNERLCQWVMNNCVFTKNIRAGETDNLCQLSYDLQLKWLDIWTNLDSKGIKVVIYYSVSKCAYIAINIVLYTLYAVYWRLCLLYLCLHFVCVI